MLSGGGAKGVWQVGACQHLIVERGYWFDVIAGVSAGAVNGAALARAHDPHELAAALEHLRAVWFGLRGDRDIYRRRWLGALGMMWGRRASLYETGPLRQAPEPPGGAGVRARSALEALKAQRYPGSEGHRKERTPMNILSTTEPRFLWRRLRRHCHSA